MKPVRSILYRFPDGGEVEFAPATDIPGVAFRIIVNRVRVGWLRKNQPVNNRQAAFWLIRRREGEEAAHRFWDSGLTAIRP